MRWTLPDKVLILPGLTILVLGWISGWPVLALWIWGFLTFIWALITLVDIRRTQGQILRLIRRIDAERAGREPRPPSSDG